MAGKRVKCKHCGVIFLIAGDARSADAGLDLSALDELNAMGESGNLARKGATAAAAGGEDIDSLFQTECPTSDGAPRTNKLYIFPLSRLLDHWLPPVLLAIGLMWVVSEAMKRTDAAHQWVGFFRGAFFLLAFFASVFPFTLMGIRQASCKLNYELPPKPGLRTMGCYAVPFAFAVAMWLLNTEVWGPAMSLLFGGVIGAVVALPVVFLLFRLLPREAPITFAYSTGFFALSLLIAAAGAFALNLMLVGSLRAMRTEHTLVDSPFGPGLKWEGPVEKAREQLAHNDTATETPTTGESATTAPSTEPSTDHATDGAPTTRTAATGPSVATQRDVLGPGDAGNNANAGQPNPNDAANVKPPRREGLVADVKVLVAGGFKQVVFPAVAGPRAAVVREGKPGHDVVELWDTEAAKRLGSLEVPRVPEGNRYALSPDGEWLCWLTDFPRLAVQVWSFGAGKFVKQIDLEANEGDPRVVGFNAPDQLVLQRNRNGQMSVQVWNVKVAGRQRPPAIAVPEFELEPGRYALSPDGTAIAIIVHGNGGGDLESYSLANGRPIKQMPIVEVNWNNNVVAAGLAYSPDSQRIAAVFADGQGAGFFVAWPAAGRGGKAQLQHFLPVGVNLPPAHVGFGGGPVFEGRAFHWLDKGRAWILHGNSIFDTESGQLLGTLNLGVVRRQSALPDGDTCLLVHTEDFGGLQFTSVKLDLPGARKRVKSG
jgi:hypothetical protein